MKYTHIIWDFNGTIMNDVDIAVAAVNDMLEKRGMPLTDRAAYLTMIESPIIRYYEKLFDLSVVPFDDIQVEFLQSYNRRLPTAGLLPGVHAALEHFAKLGLRQCVISSFEQSRLRKMVQGLKIGGYFDTVSGADDTRAEGKLDRGLEWLRQSGADPTRVLVIGDLDHDHELARHLGADCVLIAAGHQHRQALEVCGCPVLDSAFELIETIAL